MAESVAPACPLVCLSMIVKNEAHVIERALASVLPLIDCWCIVDTGSTDDTEEVAKHALRSKWGEYHHAKWEGFGAARTRALVLAEQMTAGRSAYAMVCDADDVWSGERPELTLDAHAVWTRRQAKGTKWPTPRFYRLGQGIRYEGVVHERPVQDGVPVVPTVLEGLEVLSIPDGASWGDPDKYKGHAMAIQQAMLGDPTNTRYAFYLAQSYRDAGDDERAATLYLQRAAMGGGDSPQEVYVALLEAGRCYWRLQRLDKAQSALLNAHKVAPTRLEAMAELARLFALKAATMPVAGSMFVEEPVRLDEAAQ